VCSERSEEVGEEGALSWHCGSHESGFFLSHIKERSVEEGRVGGSSLDEFGLRGGSRTDLGSRRQTCAAGGRNALKVKPCAGLNGLFTPSRGQEASSPLERRPVAGSLGLSNRRAGNRKSLVCQ
jgi:hypothetical protein